MRFLSILLVLAAPLSLCAQTHSFGQELPITEAIPGTSSDVSFTGPAIASDGEQFLVVWRGARLVFVRLNANGDPIDPLPVPIDVFSDWSSDPAVVWTGRDYVVAWSKHGHVWLAHVSREGVVRKDATPIARGVAPRLATNGSVLLILHRDESFNPHLRATVATVDGHMKTGEIDLGSVDDGRFDPTYDVAGNGIDFCAAWVSETTIVGVRISAKGESRDPFSLGFGLLPAVGASSHEYIVAFSTFTRLKAFRLRESTDPTPFFEIPFRAASRVDTASNASDLVIVDRESSDNDDVFAVGNNELIPIATAAGNQVAPTVASGSAGFLAVWIDKGEVRAKVLESSGQPREAAEDPGILLSRGTPGQYLMSTAFDGVNHVLAWREEKQIHVARVDRNGGSLGEWSISVGTNYVAPLVAYSSGVFFVVWQHDFQLFLLRLPRDSDVLDGPLVIATNRQYLSFMGLNLSPDADGVLALWVGDTIFDFEAIRIPVTGSVGSRFSIRTLPTDRINGSAWNGVHHFLIFDNDNLCHITCPPFQPKAYGLLIDSSGQPAGPIFIVDADGIADRVFWDGTEFLVTTKPFGRHGLRLRRFSYDAQLLRWPFGQDILEIPNASLLGWDGRHYLLSRTTPEGAQYLMRFSVPNQEFLDLDRPIPLPMSKPIVSRNGFGESAFFYTRFVPELGADRLFVRFFPSAPQRGRGAVR